MTKIKKMAKNHRVDIFHNRRTNTKAKRIEISYKSPKILVKNLSNRDSIVREVTITMTSS